METEWSLLPGGPFYSTSVCEASYLDRILKQFKSFPDYLMG